MAAVQLRPNLGISPIPNVSFATFLSSDYDPFDIDLQGYPLVAVLKECEKYKKVRGGCSSLLPLISNIQKIEKECNIVLKPEKVTDLFYDYFVQSLYFNGCKTSTINTYCNQLKAALRWSTKHHCTVSSTYDEFKPMHDVIDKIALSPDEVSHIYHFDISKLSCRPQHKRTLEKVRDMFVLSCNLGQRHSDMIRIEPTHFNDTKTKFKIIQKKSKNKAVVNLQTMTMDKNVTHEILEKYGYTAPYKCHISAYNRNLHELVRLIGEEFNKDHVYEYKCNGEMKSITNKRWELVTSHTARRTFITYHILRNVTETRVRRCSGHTDSRSFARYIRFNDDDD